MRIYITLAAVVGLSAVVLGAFGAHALKATLVERGTQSVWATAVLYQLVHAPAMLAAALYMLNHPASLRWLKLGQLLWLGGVVLFSGSLYLLALGGPRWLGPITPIGGLLLIAGWASLLGISVQRPAPPSSHHGG